MSDDQMNLLDLFEEPESIEAGGPAPVPEPSPPEEPKPERSRPEAPELPPGASEPRLAQAEQPVPQRDDFTADSETQPTGVWRRRALMAGWFLLVFGAGALVGRESADEPMVIVQEVLQASDPVPGDEVLPQVSAAPPELATAGEAMPVAPVAESKAASPLSAAESALFDLENQFTVRVVTYASSRSNEALARKTADHFRAKGLPVGRPHERGDKIYVVIGAASSVEDLHPLRDRIRGEVDPSGRRNQYQSAFVDRIDTVVAWRGE